MNLDLGATGKFPDGKDSVEDEGELRFAVGHDRDYVIIRFGMKVSEIWFLPKNARELAAILIKHAEEAER